MRLSMHVQREIARLHFQSDASSRQIAKATGVSATTVQALRCQITGSGKTWPELESLDDDQWQNALGTADKRRLRRKETPDWTWVHEQLQGRDVTRDQLWREWREDHPHGVAYSQFTSGYRDWLAHQRLSMRRQHRPGDKLFVDFCGRTMPIHDGPSGKVREANVFVAVLGASNYTFAQAVWTQGTADWVMCHVAAFQFFGGVVSWVVPDNLKAAVLRREHGEIIFNPSYQECLRHYGTAALPARPYKAKDKAKAEVGVQIVQRWILAALRGRVFFSLEELNQEIRRLLHLLNERVFKKLPGCRRSRFEALDSPALRPLPAAPFELADWRFQVRVGEDYHVEYERCFYSVPAALARTLVDLRISATTIEILHRHRRVAIHPRLATPGATSTHAEHRPVAHRRVLEGEPQALLQWAQNAGPSTAQLLGWHLTVRTDAANGIKAAQRLRRLADLYGKERFEEACAYALHLKIYALKSIESILRHNADRQAATAQAGSMTAPINHENVRGPGYYGGA